MKGFLVAAITGACVTTAAAAGLGPYVTSVSPSSAAIVWVSAAGSPLSVTATPERGAARSAVSSAAPVAGQSLFVHTLRLSGLAAGQRYRYSVRIDGRTASGVFMTAPPAGTAARIVVYGDTRTRPEKHALVASAIAADTPQVVLHGGDLVGNGEQWRDWGRDFFGPASAMLASAAICAVRGNHEGDGAYYRALFPTGAGTGCYSLDWGDVHIVAIDQYAMEGRTAELLGWLRADLAANRRPWTLVFYHEPTYNMAGHASHWGRDDVAPLFQKSGVDLVVAGHSHLYERFLPIGEPGAKPVVYVVSGGGGAPTAAPRANPALANGTGSDALHYCLVTVRGNRLEYLAKRPDGSVLDSLTLVKTNGRYQESLMAQALTPAAGRRLLEAFGELRGEFDPPRPAAGLPVRVSVRGGTWRAGQMLQVGLAAGETSWRVAPQSCPVRDSGFSFDASPVAQPRPTLGGFDPPLYIALSTQEDGRTLRAERMAVGFTDAMAQRSVPQPAPVDLPRLKQPVAVDGDLRDWQGVAGVPLPFTGEKTSVLRFGWDSAGLYGCYEVADSSVSADSANPWSADALEFFLDKAHSRGLTIGASGEQVAFFPRPAHGPGPAGVLIASGVNRGTQAGISAAWKPTARGYALEFRYPAAALAPAVMKAGTLLGMNFALDDDGRPVKQFYCDKDQDQAFMRPVLWGTVSLAK